MTYNVKPDEFLLMRELRARSPRDDSPWVHVRALAVELRIPTKRAEYITQKWSDRGWYDYGVHCLAGWLTDEGRKVGLNLHCETILG